MATTLQVLQHYLTAGIDIDCGRYGIAKLIGLSAHKEYSVRLAYQDGGRGSMMPDALTPILYDFSALCTPLEDQTIPAIEAIVLSGWDRTPPLQAKLVDADTIEFYSAAGVEGLLHRAQLANPLLSVADYLRSKHFAVGLQPDQFIRKS